MTCYCVIIIQFDSLIAQMDSNKVPVNIYNDLSKAFDTLDLSIESILYCIVLYCIMRPYTDGPIGPLS